MFNKTMIAAAAALVLGSFSVALADAGPFARGAWNAQDANVVVERGHTLPPIRSENITDVGG